MQENKWVFFLNIVYNGATTTTINYTVQTGAVKESKRKRNKCVSVTHKATGSQRIRGFFADALYKSTFAYLLTHWIILVS